MIRLDRFLSENTHYSRGEVKRLIHAKRVIVDTQTASKANQKIDLSKQDVLLDGTPVCAAGEIYILLNKPQGYVSATKDGEHPTIIDLIQTSSKFKGDRAQLARIQSAPLQIVGRLDKDTTGLILLTTDGGWNHTISSPNSACSKTYRVTLADPIEKNAVELFKQGIHLRNETKRTKPATLEIREARLVDTTISEGRYHQIKRMFAAIGNRVIALERIRIGALTLDSNLKQGEFRCLTKDEIERFG